MDQILWCFLSNEISLAILSHGTIDFSEVVFTKRYMEILLSFTLAIFGSERLKPLIQKPLMQE